MFKFIERIFARIISISEKREPDFIIGGRETPYVRRWWVIPRNRYFNIYLHQFLRSDDDRAHHDHPWLFNCSIILRGSYLEHTIAAGGILHITGRRAGDVAIRPGRAPHRVELITPPGGEPSPCWTLFITGPVVREWGFHCPRGWVPWQTFTAKDDRGAIGAGCGDE